MPPVGPNMGLLALRDLELAYRESGDGKPVVLIHGLAQDHRMWEHQQAGLQDLSTLALDIRGHGASTIGGADGTLAQLGGDLVGFLEEHGPAVCVGFSLGGTIAFWVAAERPDLVKGVIAMATSSVVGRAAAAGMVERIELFENGDDEAVRKLLLADTKAQLADPEIDAGAITDARMVAIGDRRGYVNGARAMLGLREEPLNDRLAATECPVLVVSGEKDVVCPRRAAEIMLEHLPSADFTELSRVGHLMTDEAPDVVTGVMREWLDTEGLA